jgi:hypothetical protein
MGLLKIEMSRFRQVPVAYCPSLTLIPGHPSSLEDQEQCGYYYLQLPETATGAQE